MPKTARPSRASVTRELIALGRRFYARGWVLGTSGNFSVVRSRRPLRLVLTASARHKGRLGVSDFVEVTDGGTVTAARGRKPSAETALHQVIARARGAGAVLHTHSVWSTILSERHAAAGALTIHGYEMLKGLDGVRTHEHHERIPIVPNDQDMTRLAGVVSGALSREPGAHGLLLAGHGLYTWGRTLADAERHVEILEFLFEVVARRSQSWR